MFLFNSKWDSAFNKYYKVYINVKIICTRAHLI